MTTRQLHAALDAIENADPVADLAVRLAAEGISEEAVCRALGQRMHSPIGNELWRKYRDVQHGWTENHYHKQIRYDQPPPA